MTTTRHEATTAQEATGRRRAPRWAVPLLAVAAALLVWMIGAAAGVGDVVVDTGAAMQQATVASVIVAGLLAGFAGWGARAVIDRISRDPARAQRIWLIVSGLVLLVSLLGPLGAVTTGALLVLLAEHVIVGLTVMLGLRR